MLLANPIYDTIFKYLLEDLELAKQLISKIIGEEIVEINTQAREAATKLSKYELTILRLDFKAVILTQEGLHKKVLIELQKAQQLGDIMRFRKYLGNNYLKEDTFETEFKEPDGLPIITIYFLGFPLKNIPTPVLKVNRVYIDLVTNKQLYTKEEFVEKLTHDSYIIQIPRLEKEVRTELERVLTVFNQAYITTDRKILQLQEEDLGKGENELLEKLVGRLRKAVSDDQLLLELELEEEYTRILDDAYRKALIAEEKLLLAEEKAEKEVKLAEEKAEERVKAVQNKMQLIEEKYQALLVKMQGIEKEQDKPIQEGEEE